MDHVAIMKKEWGLIPLILAGKKTVESRWYKSKIAPWNKIKAGDTIYFKDSSGPVTAKATVTEVNQHKVSDNVQALEIMRSFAVADLGTAGIPKPVLDYITNKKYAVFVTFNNVQKVTPFSVDKTGYGLQCAWMCVGDIKKVAVTR